MNLGLTDMMSNYYVGGLYPWNNLSYTGGLYPWNNSYMNGLGYQSTLSGLNFSNILNKAYNTEGKGYSIEIDKNGQVSKITVKDAEEQTTSSSEQKVKDVNERKSEKVERMEVQEAYRRFQQSRTLQRLDMQECWKWNGHTGNWDVEKYDIKF